MDFHKLKTATTLKFNSMKEKELFVTKATSDDMWSNYLASFPEGTNPVFRARTEHDCGCCRQFIRAIGNVVSIVDNKLVSMWDVKVDDPAYQVVADSMAKMVKSQPIEDIFLHSEVSIGTDKNYEDNDGKVTTWNHFFVRIANKGQNHSIHYCAKPAIATKQSEIRSTFDVAYRALTEIDGDSVNTVLELIKQNSLYRGEEHKFVVEEFRKLRSKFMEISESGRRNFLWSKIKDLPGSVSHIRTSAIGTLLIDLAEGKDLEDAVNAFEFKVSAGNYKRSTALVTKKMVEAARTKIAELGLTSALERRYAHLSDITINNILFANRETKKVIEGDVFDSIATKTSTPKNLDKVEEITIEKFLKDVVPNAESIEVLIENKHVGNLVSLIAPTHADAGNLFKWDNKFSWTYNGDVADSIKERVKKAGGNVVGDLCCRLAWYNYDDLDFHIVEPGGYEIYYANRGHKSSSGGRLDVDMNAGQGTTREPVENIFYESRSTMREGEYHLFVHNYSQRETTNVGFEVELDYLGTVTRFAYEKPVRNNERVTVARFKYSRKDGIEMIESLRATQVSKVIWNTPTQEYAKVNVLMMSPNYWDERGVGNKHYFFMLDGCKNDGSARGFYNEFLKEELMPHRKVIEMVGSKMKTEESAEQLSGLGFSSTQRNEILVRVKGSFTRTIKVTF